MVFILQFVNVVYHTDGFAGIEEPLHPWDKSHLIMMYSPFNVLRIQFASVLFRIFTSMFISVLACNFLFCGVFVWLWYQGDGGLIE